MPPLDDIIGIVLSIGQFLDDHAGSISAISTVFVAAFTYTLWRATTKLWESSKTHARHLESSIAEAGRSAAAMERVAGSLDRTATSAAENTKIVREIGERQRDFAKLQMRPYLSIVEPGFIPQDAQRGTGAGLQVIVLNTGHTPAHNFRFYARINVLPFPLPDDFDFVIPDRELTRSGHLNPGQRFFFRRSLDRLMTDAEFADVMANRGRALYIYGTVFFTDPFGDEHYTNFSQYGMWAIGGNLLGAMNTPQHNYAT
jgi:hypothetical protein